MFPRWLNRLMWYFDLSGLSSEFHTTSTYQKVIRFAITFQFLLGIIVTALLIVYLRRPINDPLGTLNDVIKHGGNTVVYWLALIELSTKQSIRRRFWKIFNKIDSQFCCHRDFILRNYLIKFYLCMFAFLIAFIFYLNGIVSHTGTRILYFWFTHFILSILFLNRVFYYLFYMELIKYELCNIERETKEMAKSKKKFFMNDFEKKRFLWIREYFQSVYQMCNYLNKFLTYSNAATIIFSFQFIVTDILWIYWKIYNKHHIQPFGWFEFRN